MHANVLITQAVRQRVCPVPTQVTVAAAHMDEAPGCVQFALHQRLHLKGHTDIVLPSHTFWPLQCAGWSRQPWTAFSHQLARCLPR